MFPIVPTKRSRRVMTFRTNVPVVSLLPVEPAVTIGPVMPALLLRGQGRNPAAGRAGPRVDAQGRGDRSPGRGQGRAAR